jgi:hypothetical protein
MFQDILNRKLLRHFIRTGKEVTWQNILFWIIAALFSVLSNLAFSFCPRDIMYGIDKASLN